MDGQKLGFDELLKYINDLALTLDVADLLVEADALYQVRPQRQRPTDRDGEDGGVCVEQGSRLSALTSVRATQGDDADGVESAVPQRYNAVMAASAPAAAAAAAAAVAAASSPQRAAGGGGLAPSSATVAVPVA